MLPSDERERLLNSYSDEEKAAVYFDWPFWARPSQLPPEGDWQIWLLKTGRGWGKTMTAAQFCRKKAEEMPGSRGMLVAPTPRDAIDVMVEGASGILECCPPWNKPNYEPSKLRLTWPNGSMALIRSAFDPGSIRGPEFNWAWAEELCVWKKLPKKIDTDDPRKDDPWRNLMLGLRSGESPQVVVTTTPKPIPLMIALVEAAKKGGRVVMTEGSSYENFDNLADAYIDEILSLYEGTSFEEQEIFGGLMLDVKGALLKRETFDKYRFPFHPDLLGPHPEFAASCIAVDPPGGVTEAGIIAAARTEDGNCLITEDLSLSGPPEVWGDAAVEAFIRYRADAVIGERNFGGDMVESVIRAAADRKGIRVPFVYANASRGKHVRAQPVSLLYQKGAVRNVGTHPQLESEWTTWLPDDPESPNRLDACVFAVHWLMLGGQFHEKGFHGVTFG